MGKKTKKKSGQKVPKNQQTDNNPSSSHAKKAKAKLDSDQVSLYRIYKHCNEAVIQWGKATYSKKYKKTPKKIATSLSHVLFDILTSLADDGVLMPRPVLEDLRLTIFYRKKVSKIFHMVWI